jgi:glc operon protein GlcG
MRVHSLALLIACGVLLIGVETRAQQPAPAPAPPIEYGPTVTLDQARKAADAALAEAKKNNWLMAVAVVGPTGDLVYFAKMDNTQYQAIPLAQHKARAAAVFKRPTKALEERGSAGGAGIASMTLDGMIASAGGVLIVADGKIIGAVGTSGGTGEQDAVVSTAGVNAIK